MIFVILGTQKFQLNRLLKQVDMEIEAGNITEEVFAQRGNSDYQPRHYTYADFLDKEEFEQKICQASVIITHSGVGSIMTAIQAGRPVLVYPRLEKYHEHVDDHQVQIARAFASKNYVMYCEEEDALGELVEKCKCHTFEVYRSQTNNIVKYIRDCI